MFGQVLKYLKLKWEKNCAAVQAVDLVIKNLFCDKIQYNKIHIPTHAHFFWSTYIFVTHL